MLKRKCLLFCFVFFIYYIHAQTIVLKSPDNQLRVKIFKEEAQLKYTLQSQMGNVITASIGIQSQKGVFGQDVQSIKLLKEDTQIQYTLDVRGNHNTATILKNSYVIEIKSTKTSQNFLLNYNVYNNGMAVSYQLSSPSSPIKKSLNAFQIPSNTTLWFQDDIVDYEANYETLNFANLKHGQKLGMPLTLQYSSGSYASIMESNLGQSAGSYLQFDTSRSQFQQILAGEIEIPKANSYHSPWTVVTVSKDLNGLVNNEILNDVADQPDKLLFPRGLHTQWIQPGMALWSWMSNDRTVSPENMMKFTDLASQLHIPYNLIDEGWSYWKTKGKDSWEMLKEQVDYAKSKNVGIWIWKAYPDRGNVAGLKDSVVLEKFMQKCSEIGIKGLKIDFFDSEKQPEIAFYARAAKIAAKYQLMLDYHGANKGTGLEQTYPNVLTQEGVRGLEQEYNVNWPQHNTILPFTRYLSGPADYTPMSFRPFVYSTTLAHQAASVAIFTSPFLCLGVDPEDLLKSPAQSFIQNLPSTWDETIVLKDSKIGKIAAFARRKKDIWYIAVLNGLEPKTINIPLNFLTKGRSYQLKSMSNDLTTRETQVPTAKKTNPRETLKIDLPFGGGYLGILTVE